MFRIQTAAKSASPVEVTFSSCSQLFNPTVGRTRLNMGKGQNKLAKGEAAGDCEQRRRSASPKPGHLA